MAPTPSSSVRLVLAGVVMTILLAAPAVAAHECHNATGACLPNGKYMCLTTRAHRLEGGDVIEHARGKGTGNMSRSHPDDETHDHAHEHVLWRQRCDGIEDCPDGTDEMACELPNLPPDHPVFYHPIRDQPNEEAENAKSPLGGETNHSTSSGRTFGRGRIMHPLFVQSTCIGCQCKFAAPTIGKTHPWYTFAIAARPVPAFGKLCPSGKPCNPTGTLSISLQLYKKNMLCKKAVCCAEQAACVACVTDSVTGLLGNAATKCYSHSCPNPTAP